MTAPPLMAKFPAAVSSNVTLFPSLYAMVLMPLTQFVVVLSHWPLTFPFHVKLVPTAVLALTFKVTLVVPMVSARLPLVREPFRKVSVPEPLLLA